MVLHALNRGVGGMKIFSTERDYLASERAIEETVAQYAPASATA